MLKRKASGFIAAMFATAAITGTAFAEDLAPVSEPADTTSNVVSESVVSSPTTTVAPEVTTVTEPAAPVTPVGGTVEGEPTTPVDGNVIGEPTAPVEGDTEGKPAAPVEGDVVGEPTAPVEGDAEGEPTSPVTGDVVGAPTVPAEAPLEEALPTEAAPAVVEEPVVEEIPPVVQEAAVLIINHHFETEGVVCDDYETITGYVAGDTVNISQFNYTDEYDFTVCTTDPNEEKTLEAGDNVVTLNYVLADGYAVID